MQQLSLPELQNKVRLNLEAFNELRSKLDNLKERVKDKWSGIEPKLKSVFLRAANENICNTSDIINAFGGIGPFLRFNTVEQLEEDFQETMKRLEREPTMNFRFCEGLTCDHLSFLYKKNAEMKVTIVPFAEFIVSQTKENLSKTPFIKEQLASTKTLVFEGVKLEEQHLEFIAENLGERGEALQLTIKKCENIGYEQLVILKNKKVKLVEFEPL